MKIPRQILGWWRRSGDPSIILGFEDIEPGPIYGKLAIQINDEEPDTTNSRYTIQSVSPLPLSRGFSGKMKLVSYNSEGDIETSLSVFYEYRPGGGLDRVRGSLVPNLETLVLCHFKGGGDVFPERCEAGPDFTTWYFLRINPPEWAPKAPKQLAAVREAVGSLGPVPGVLGGPDAPTRDVVPDNVQPDLSGVKIEPCCGHLPVFGSAPNSYPGSVQLRCPVCGDATEFVYSTVSNSVTEAVKMWNEKKTRQNLGTPGHSPIQMNLTREELCVLMGLVTHTSGPPQARLVPLRQKIEGLWKAVNPPGAA